MARISAIGDFRPGSVSEFFTLCGRPACQCQQQGDPGHGPYFRLVFQSAGKRTCRSISARQAKVLRAEVAECQRLRRLLAELIAVSEQLSEARLQHAAADSDPQQAKKACAQEFVPAIEAEIARFVAPGAAASVDLEALETRVRQRALELAARAVERRFSDDLSDHLGPTQPCPRWGRAARSAGRRDKTFETVLGALTLRRAYYHCTPARLLPA